MREYLFKRLSDTWIYVLVSFFIALNAYCIFNEFYYFPAVSLVLAAIYAAFFKMHALFLFVVFSTPLSLNLERLELGGIGLYLPTEPLMFGLMLFFFIRLIHYQTYEVSIIRHPVTLAVIVNLSWLLITSITSEMPIVSFKFLLARLWFVVCFYFLMIQLFKRKNYFKGFFVAYIIPLTGVIIYSVVRLFSYDFAENPSHWVMSPFYKDHTSYGAILAMYFPILFIFLSKRYTTSFRLFVVLLILIFLIGIILSYTRAAWVSLAGAFVLFLVYRYRVKFKVLMIAGVAALIVSVVGWNSLFDQLSRNNQDSSMNLSEHVTSISNVSTDASNLERLNRWNSAWRMFLERPIFGWGPGTYTFQYAPFQSFRDKTIISTNAGTNGNAHSEYIGPLAESGFLGTITFIMIVVMVFYRGSLLYHRLPDGELKNLVLVTLLGLFTYVLHGFLNNYLDTDKASVPFWGFIALIVATDIANIKTRCPSER